MANRGGAEIVVKAISEKEVFSKAGCIVNGDHKMMEKAICLMGIDVKIHLIRRSGI